MKKSFFTDSVSTILQLVVVLVPGHGAQNCARVPTNGYVQTRAPAPEPSLNGALVTVPLSSS